MTGRPGAGRGPPRRRKAAGPRGRRRPGTGPSRCCSDRAAAGARPPRRERAAGTRVVPGWRETGVRLGECPDARPPGPHATWWGTWKGRVGRAAGTVFCIREAAVQLARSRNQKMFGGVCGGLAEYFGWQVTAVRRVFVISCILHWSLVLSYCLLWLLLQ